MICRGESKLKASFLTNIINRTNFDINNSAGQPKGLNLNDERFKRAIKLMLQISTTLPVMFLQSNINNTYYKSILKKTEEKADPIWDNPFDSNAEI